MEDQKIQSCEKVTAKSDMNIEQPKIRSVFSYKTIQKIGSGTTSRKSIRKVYLYAEEQANEQIDIRNINKEMLPSGESKLIPREELLERFTPEPDIYHNQVYPKMRDKERHIAKGDRLRKNGQNFSAEMEYTQALVLDESSVRATFGIGLCYLERNDEPKAKLTFEKLMNLNDINNIRYKHLFNEFGINLRKNNLFDEAVRFYNSALELEKDDENLYFNLGRALFQKQEYEKAQKAFDMSLSINPKLVPAIEFSAIVKKKIG